MSSLVRWLVAGIVFAHGAIHLLGVAKGLGWARVPQLRAPISDLGGLAWLGATVLVIGASTMIALGKPSWWWLLAGVAVVVSEAVILSSWSDAKAGTVANVLLAVAAVYGFVSVGPASPAEHWRRQAEGALTQISTAQPLVTQSDLGGLPAPLAAYVRESGAVGRPRIVNFVAEVSGRIRGGPDKAWMEFSGRQVNTYGANPQRYLFMDARMAGLPVAVTHVFGESSATMQGRLLSLIPVVRSAGPDMDRAETVTVFNDLVVMAPGAIPYAPVRWTAVDDRHVRGSFTKGSQTVSAELEFNERQELVNFVSDDRIRASPDGSSLTRMRWSTPILAYRDFSGRKVASIGEGRWHAGPPEGDFTYLTFRADGIHYDVSSARGLASANRTAVASEPTPAR